MPRKKKSPNTAGNEMEGAIKAAREAYAGVPEAKEAPVVGGVGKGEDEERRMRKMAPLPHPRQGGKLISGKEWAALLTDEQVEAWAENFVATGRRQGLFWDRGGPWTKENNLWRAESTRAVEALPAAMEAVARLKDECVMSTLERRKKLKKISEAPEHPMKGLADNLKAIELDAKEDPEAVQNAKLVGGGVEGVTNVLNMFCLPDDAIVAVKAAKALADGGGRKVIEADFSVADGVGVKVEPQA